MPNALSFADIDAQRVELLPPRTVLSLFSISSDGGNFGGGGASIGCQNSFAPNAPVGLLGLFASTPFSSNGCTAVIH
jgi:hypothetical protein